MSQDPQGSCAQVRVLMCGRVREGERERGCELQAQDKKKYGGLRAWGVVRRLAGACTLESSLRCLRQRLVVRN